MSWPCRCRRKACQARQTIRWRPESYVRPPKCRRCGKGLLRVDGWRQAHERHSKTTCRPDRSGCQGYHFPHRRGSRWCDHNPALTPAMLEERERWTR